MITDVQRRRLMVRRHHLAGDGGDAEEVTRALVALHATDPATVYLSVLARSRTATLADVADAMYARRSLVRWMAMRRTLFVVAREDVPVVQAAASGPVAATLRRRLVSRVTRNGSEPPIDGDVGRWLGGVEEAVQTALTARGSATGAQLSADVPALATTILPGAPSDRPQKLTSALLTMMSAEGRLVRGTPLGSWTSRQHRWEPVAAWWPQGLPACDPATARRELSRRWLQRFGPATAEDLQWWTGWNKTDTRRALEGLELEEVDLHGLPGIALPGVSDELIDDAEPVATLLPALDPTPMGYRHRDWFMAIDPHRIFDRAGNIGPTLWWDGELIGSWTVAADGELRTAIVADRGAQARDAITRAAAELHVRMEGAHITPAVRTPLERTLAG